MTHPEILRAERFGSRQAADCDIGICEMCGRRIMLCRGEGRFGFCGELLCGEQCLSEMMRKRLDGRERA